MDPTKELGAVGGEDMEDTDRERELGRNENKLFGILQGFTY
jgi:hypothetical protein